MAENPFARFAVRAEEPQNPFAQYAVQPAAAPGGGAAPPQVSTAEDMAKGAVSGLAQGGIELATLPGAMTNFGRTAMAFLADQTAGRIANRLTRGTWDAGTAAREGAARDNAANPYTPERVQGAVESVTGKFYEPQTVAGQYTRTIARNTPYALLTPGGVVARGAAVGLSGAAEETAGQMTQGSAIEPYARAAANIGGGLAAMGAARAVDNSRRAAGLANAPTREELEAASRAAYQAADAAGVRFTPEGARQMVARADDEFVRAGADAMLHPRAARAGQRLDEIAATGPTLSEMEIARRVAGQAARTTDAADSAMASRLIRQIDDFVTAPPPGAVASGDAAAGAAALEAARGNWAAASRSEIIDTAIKNAELRAASTGTGANIDNALRQEFRKILTNDDLRRGFNPSELDAIERVVKGAPLQSLARLVGRFAPTGVVSGTGSAGIGYAAGGLTGAAATTGGGAIAKFLADRQTINQAERVADMVRARSPAASPVVRALLDAPPSIDPARLQIARLLLLGRQPQTAATAGVQD